MSHKPAPAATLPDPVLNLGEVLRRSGKVTQAQIDEAVVVAADRGCRLGEALVQIGACSIDDVEIALDRQRRMRDPKASTLAALGEIFDDAVIAIGAAAGEAREAASRHTSRQWRIPRTGPQHTPA